MSLKHLILALPEETPEPEHKPASLGHLTLALTEKKMTGKQLKGLPGQQGSPLEVVVDPEHGLVLLARVLDVHAAGEAQLMLRQPQLLQGLLRGNQPETLRGKRE